MPSEIPIAGGSLGSNDGQPIRQFRKGQFLLHVHVAFPGEEFYGTFALQGLLPQGERRVYVFNEKADAVQFAVAHLHFYQHGDAGLQGLPCSLLEKGLEPGVIPFPDHGAALGHRLPAPALGELQVAVPVGPRAERRNFRLNPIPLREGILNALPDPFLQLQQVHVLPFRHSFWPILFARAQNKPVSVPEPPVFARLGTKKAFFVPGHSGGSQI